MIAAAGSCPHCGCNYRKPSDAFGHRCAAMQEAMERLPGPVPVDGQEDRLVWPTWREAILDAKTGVETAYDRRRRVFQAAFDAGLSLRQIAGAAGMTAAGVHNVIGKQRGKADAVLDEPSFQNPRGRA
jgi:DNA-directed RNA polymerase specialized sigma24 family protein